DAASPLHHNSLQESYHDDPAVAVPFSSIVTLEK
ncbi:hypothetical protein L914_08736, partial [Phytophthora nicotianae]